MNNDLISRSELKKAVENLVAGGEERLIEYYKNGSKSEENEWIGGIYDAWEEIIDAPPIETTIENLISTLSIEELKATTWFKVDTPSGESISFRREKTGHWIKGYSDLDYEEYKCSVCGRVIVIYANLEMPEVLNKYPYCNCGAYMRGEENG